MVYFNTIKDRYMILFILKTMRNLKNQNGSIPIIFKFLSKGKVKIMMCQSL